jgi:hypothetical protein
MIENFDRVNGPYFSKSFDGLWLELNNQNIISESEFTIER